MKLQLLLQGAVDIPGMGILESKDSLNSAVALAPQGSSSCNQPADRVILKMEGRQPEETPATSLVLLDCLSYSGSPISLTVLLGGQKHPLALFLFP